MSSDLDRAVKMLLEDEGSSCVLCAGDTVYSSRERGVKPLVDWIDSDLDLRHFSAADRIVGRAAAFLYVILGVDAVYAPVMSEEAISTLSRYGISQRCDTPVKEIRNRENTGCCPMEAATADCTDPYAALENIRRKLASLKKAGQALTQSAENEQ